jgi:hypothetical protein
MIHPTDAATRRHLDIQKDEIWLLANGLVDSLDRIMGHDDIILIRS